MPLYFAYGLNMDAAGMAQRCPKSKPLGPARLPRHRFIITADGYASVIRDPRESVHGVLWDCALADMRTLDKFEELDRGLYVKISQPVVVAGGSKRALVYVGRTAEPGRPRPGYLEPIIASGRGWGLPEAYLAGLARLAGKPLPEARSQPQPPAPLPAGPVAGVRPRAASPLAASRARDGEGSV
jgi:gamma-glutamylcyclotransferase (GGCT)/AIG2-like uncharacterized protein YtfP